jgi:hypothetical protein
MGTLIFKIFELLKGLGFGANKMAGHWQRPSSIPIAVID